MRAATGPLGLSFAEFWSLTPAELNMLIEGYNARQEQRYHELITQAWVTASLMRRKKLPSLKSLLKSNVKKDVDQARQEFEELLKRSDANG